MQIVHHVFDAVRPVLLDHIFSDSNLCLFLSHHYFFIILFWSFLVVGRTLFSVTFWLSFALFFRFFRFRATLLLVFWAFWFDRTSSFFGDLFDKFFNFLWVFSKIRGINLRFGCHFPCRSFRCNFNIGWKLLALLLGELTLPLWQVSSRRFWLQFCFLLIQLLICNNFYPFRTHSEFKL